MNTRDRPPESSSEDLGSGAGIRGLRGLFVVALVVIILAGARAASGLIAGTLLGLMLAVAAAPILTASKRQKWPTVAGAILASGALLVLASAFGMLLTVAGSELASELPQYRSSLEMARDNLKTSLIAYDLEPLLAVVDQAADISQIDVLPRVLRAATSLGSIIFVLFIALFALFEAPTFANKWRRVTSSDPRSWENAARALGDVQRYLVVKTGTCMLTGVFVGIWTAVLGLDGATLWGFLAFALNYIPFIGSLFAGVPPTTIALLSVDPLTGLLVGVGIFIINISVGNILEPRIMGRTMGLSPLVVLLSVALWGWVLGPVGALLSVPLTVIVKIVLERSERYAWVAVLLDSPTRFRDKNP